jgi:CheY-like chemotaxis protein
MDGPTTIAALRRLSAALPIISCSGFAAKARNENGEKISAFIPKPYTTEALVGTVAAALGKSAAPPDESNQF